MQPLNVLSIARAAVEIQRAPAEFRRIAEELAITPALVIDGKPLYERTDVDAIAEHLETEKEQAMPPTLTTPPPRRFNETETEEIQDLLSRDELTQKQFRRLAELANVSGDLPEPDRIEDGEPVYRKATIQEWGKQAIQHRNATMTRPQIAPRGQVRAATWRDDDRSFEAVFASETRVAVVDFSRGVVDEILVADGGEFPGRFPVLDSHQRGNTSHVIGSARDVRREGSQWLGRIYLADDTTARSIGNKVKDGHLDSVSIGYRIDQYEEIPPGQSRTIGNRSFRNEYDRALRVVTRWAVREVSVVPFGADPLARVRSQTRAATGFRGPAIHSRDSVSHIPHSGELVSALLMRLGTNDPSQCRAHIASDGNITRLAPTDSLEADADTARRLYSDMPLSRLLSRAARLDGVRSIGESLYSYDYHLVCQHFRSGMSTLNIDSLFTDAFATLVLAAFDAAGDSTRGWVGESDELNLLPTPNLRLTAAELKRRHRGGEAHHMNFATTREDSQVGCYAGQIEIDEIDIINQTAEGMMQSAATAMAQAARALRPNLVYSLLARNPAMKDGDTLFHANHGNLKTTAALADDKLGEAQAAIAGQQENGIPLNLRGQYLVVPVAKERLGGKLIKEVELVAEQSTPAPFLRSDSRLDNGLVDPVTEEKHAGSTSTWYMSATGQHGLQAQYLKGSNRQPMLRRFFLTQGQFGVNFSIEHYIGIAALGWQGLVKCTE